MINFHNAVLCNLEVRSAPHPSTSTNPTMQSIGCPLLVFIAGFVFRVCIWIRKWTEIPSRAFGIFYRESPGRVPGRPSGPVLVKKNLNPEPFITTLSFRWIIKSQRAPLGSFDGILAINHFFSCRLTVFQEQKKSVLVGGCLFTYLPTGSWRKCQRKCELSALFHLFWLDTHSTANRGSDSSTAGYYWWWRVCWVSIKARIITLTPCLADLVQL